jgi:hypothetical protein
MLYPKIPTARKVTTLSAWAADRRCPAHRCAILRGVFAQRKPITVSLASADYQGFPATGRVAHRARTRRRNGLGKAGLTIVDNRALSFKALQFVSASATG